MAALPPPLPPLSPNDTLPYYDDHTREHQRSTVPQMVLFVIWVAAVVLWVLKLASRTNLLPRLWPVVPPPSEVDTLVEQGVVPTTTAAVQEPDSVTVTVNGAVPAADTQPSGEVGEAEALVTGGAEGSTTQCSSTTATGSGERTTSTAKQNFSTVIPPPSLEQFLLQIIRLGIVMSYFWLCDYRKIFPLGERVYERDTFLFVVFIFFLVGCFCTLRPTKDTILNRDHTEEWKGWMQVMFVWYHYFCAKEWYNWIRVYIACYVWMTGFGNFSFFWVRKDFSAWRAAKMLFRLDFLVIVICLTVSNPYMIYYICAMHTYWFLSVYAVMGVLRSWNEQRVGMVAKLAVYAIVNAAIFDVPTVAGRVFRPLSFVLGLEDNLVDNLHEWLFRAGLDHWVCFVGMLCAYNYPHWDTLIRFLEGEFNSRRCFGVIGRGDLAKLGILAVLSVPLGVWLCYVLPMEKYSYNRLHPYTSWIPIVVYIIVRNLWPALRVRHVYLFAWLGKITLETYLAQLHIYLQSNAKHLITYIPRYAFMNFSLATIIFLTASYHLFHVTTEFSAFLLPTDRKLMLRNCGLFGMLVVGSTVFVLTLRLSAMT